MRWSLLVLAFVIAGGGVVWAERRTVYDWSRLYNYTPPQDIAALANNTTMNDLGRHIYYVQHPEVDAKLAFNSHCRSDEQTIVLGCYIQAQGIYTLKVDDTRLAGVEEVTAAHELLHAAYDRLSSGERQQIDAEITAVYARVTNERIRTTIDAYRKAGADVANELHSILGTEVASLSPTLETHYKKYFTDRQKVVRYSEQYESAFNERKAKVDAYTQTLTSLKKQIEAQEADLVASGKQIDDSRAVMDKQLADHQIDAFNSSVPGFNKQVNAYNGLVAKTKSDIDTYNKTLEDRNALALEEQQLFKAIDSRPFTEKN